jgi:hypothetical protein
MTTDELVHALAALLRRPRDAGDLAAPPIAVPPRASRARTRASADHDLAARRIAVPPRGPRARTPGAASADDVAHGCCSCHPSGDHAPWGAMTTPPVPTYELARRDSAWEPARDTRWPRGLAVCPDFGQRGDARPWLDGGAR